MSRRSRMRRESRGKHLVLTERDLAIFRLLERYRYLNSEYIRAFVGGRSAKRFKERLGDLFHEGYLDRPPRQWEHGESRHRPVIYESHSGGGPIVQNQQIDPPPPLTFLTAAQHRQFLHSVMICHVLAAMELVARQSRATQLIGWSEILAKAPITTQQSKAPFAVPVGLGSLGGLTEFQTRTSVVPDAVFGLRYGLDPIAKFRFFALEIDRGTMPVFRAGPSGTSYARKLAAYRELLDRRLFKSFWGLPNLLVLTVSSNVTHLQNLSRCAAGPEKERSAFLFKALSENALLDPIRALQTVASPWVTADNREVDIFSP